MTCKILSIFSRFGTHVHEIKENHSSLYRPKLEWFLNSTFSYYQTSKQNVASPYQNRIVNLSGFFDVLQFSKESCIVSSDHKFIRVRVASSGNNFPRLFPSSPVILLFFETNVKNGPRTSFQAGRDYLLRRSRPA